MHVLQNLDTLECVVPVETAAPSARSASTLIIRVDKTMCRGNRCVREVDRSDDVDDDGKPLRPQSESCPHMRGTRCILPEGDEKLTVSSVLHKVTVHTYT